MTEMDQTETSTNKTSKDPNWERELISKLAQASLSEQKKTRRWGMVFKMGLLAYLFIALYVFSSDFTGGGSDHEGKHTAVVDVVGVIAPGKEASAENIIHGLQKAFEDKDTAGVILRINSPGGSPVQAGMVYDEIKRLRSEYPDIPLHAVLEDVCASGGYYIAAAADKIYADKASIVGSIGVRMDSFGFVDAMKTLGVERRLLTAGANKGMLDPFLPSDEQEIEHIQTMLNAIHQQFIDVVRQGRGERLQDDPKLFSGLIWTGAQGVENGLVDELASSEKVARDVIGEKHLVNFSPRKNFLQKLAEQMGASIGSQIQNQLQGWHLN